LRKPKKANEESKDVGSPAAASPPVSFLGLSEPSPVCPLPGGQSTTDTGIEESQ
jgi:hypothetical protein